MRCPHCCLWRLWAVSGEKPLSGETNSEAQGSSLENSQWSPLFVEYRLRAIIHPRRLKTAFYGAPHSQGSRYNQREPGSWGEGRGWRERWKVTTTPPGGHCGSEGNLDQAGSAQALGQHGHRDTAEGARAARCLRVHVDLLHISDNQSHPPMSSSTSLGASSRAWCRSLPAPEVSGDVTACVWRKAAATYSKLSAGPGAATDSDRWIWFSIK